MTTNKYDKGINREKTQQTGPETSPCHLTNTDKIDIKIMKEISKNNLNENLIKKNINLLSNRKDWYGNNITKGGKQRVTFIDKITNNTFIDVVKIECFKDYNKVEPINNDIKIKCCILV